MAENENGPLFETRPVKGRFFFKLFVASVAVGIGFICAYRLWFLRVASGKLHRWAWIGLFLCELWFSFYWFLTVICRWNPVYRFPYKNRLSQRYKKETLPGVDIFVCTADPSAEPPLMVMNTVLSVMAYDYPPEKLNIYLSDDGASDFTFYAMLEASSFSKQWLPFCRKFKVEPRSPEAYFKTAIEPDNHDPVKLKHWLSIKKLYEETKMRIETSRKMNKIPEDIRKQHKGFREWDFVTSRNDHQTILQILIDGRDPNAVDVEGNVLPTLVYLAREKRPQYHHHFKAGAMNALVNCDMYSNDSDSINDSLCVFMDHENGHEIAFVQYPQAFHNLTKNDLYGNSCRVFRKDLTQTEGRAISEPDAFTDERRFAGRNMTKPMGLKYGCPVEDIITGLSIQCRGWKSIFLDPERESFLGIAPTTLSAMLVQHKRWAEGHFQIFLSRYCTLLYGHNRIPLQLQLCYCIGNLWAANCLPTLYYVLVPCLCLLRDIPLFPKISSPWVLPFAYVSIAHRAYSLGEFLWCGCTFQAWCNEQRMWLFKRTTSYFFAAFDTVLKLLGYSKSAFVITPKVADRDVSSRYEQELMEFDDSSPMFDVLASLAMLNMFGILGVIKKLASGADHSELPDRLGLQILLCLLLVALNWPVYKAMFYRKDKGRMPASVTYKSIIYALLVSTLTL
ncbi:hypothetical protein V6N13_141564 [Hibiscus sabdariffa]